VIPSLPESLPLQKRFDALETHFRAVADPQQRFTQCVDLARLRPLLPDGLRMDAHRVEGCQVRIWFVPSYDAGRCWFSLDSDALTLKAVAGLLCELYNGCTPEEILKHPGGLPEEWRLSRQLAENRRKTVERIAASIQAFAQTHAPAYPSPPLS
jgi:cysteine desulfuration protein SufE